MDSVTKDGLIAECILPDCHQARMRMFLGWHENKVIEPAYCEDHGPVAKVKRCPECGTVKSSRLVWPDGIQPAGVCGGEISTLTVG